MITENPPVKVKFGREKSLQPPKKEEEGGPGMVLALRHIPNRLKSLLSKRVVTTTRDSHKNALSSRVAKSLRSSEKWGEWKTPNREKLSVLGLFIFFSMKEKRKRREDKEELVSEVEVMNFECWPWRCSFLIQSQFILNSTVHNWFFLFTAVYNWNSGVWIKEL